LPKRFADASLFKATTKLPPKLRACAKYEAWPRCNTSNTPLVNTTGPMARMAAMRCTASWREANLDKKAGGSKVVSVMVRQF
jgi:hypothetical protein